MCVCVGDARVCVRCECVCVCECDGVGRHTWPRPSGRSDMGSVMSVATARAALKEEQERASRSRRTSKLTRKNTGKYIKFYH